MPRAITGRLMMDGGAADLIRRIGDDRDTLELVVAVARLFSRRRNKKKKVRR